MPKRADADPDDQSLGSVDPALHPPIPFPEADWQWFAARTQALGISDPGPRRQVLEALFGHLCGVNRWLNLTTITAPREYLKLHVLDSLAAESDTRLRHLGEGEPCLDLGSGGGYPGLPLALWHPTVPWVVADARLKKAEFLAAAARLTGLPRLTARHLRGGQTKAAASDLFRRCQLVVSRAMGRCATVLAEAAPLLARHGHCLVYKGPAYAGEERAEARSACAALGFRALGERSVALEPSDPERVIVAFERI